MIRKWWGNGWRGSSGRKWREWLVVLAYSATLFLSIVWMPRALVTYGEIGARERALLGQPPSTQHDGLPKRIVLRERPDGRDFVWNLAGGQAAFNWKTGSEIESARFEIDWMRVLFSLMVGLLVGGLLGRWADRANA